MSLFLNPRTANVFVVHDPPTDIDKGKRECLGLIGMVYKYSLNSLTSITSSTWIRPRRALTISVSDVSVRHYTTFSKAMRGMMTARWPSNSVPCALAGFGRLSVESFAVLLCYIDLVVWCEFL